MNVQDEIEAYADTHDKPALRWLFKQYHWDSEWRFVAACTWQQYGTYSYQVRRIWKPTLEGRVLYSHFTIQEQL